MSADLETSIDLTLTMLKQKFLDTLLLPFCSDIQALENCVFPFMVPDVEFKLFISGTSQLHFIMSYSEIFSTTE